MADLINIAAKASGDTLTAGEFNTVVNKTNDAITEQNATKAAHAEAIALRVEKVGGKGLSTNDYTTEEKNKLAGIAENANNYQHPGTHPASMINETEGLKIMTAAERVKLAGLSEHDKGFFADEAAIIAAYAVGQAGWFVRNGETDTVWVWDVEGAAWKDTGSSASSGGGIVDILYADLVAAIGASTLVPGTFYRITNFATRHYMDNGSQMIDVINVGQTEPLLVMALSANSISSEAKSSLFPQDIIHYDWNPANWLWDNGFSDTTTDDENPTIIDGFKGVIMYRHDTINNNKVSYDFRNVKFRRYKISAAIWDVATSYNTFKLVEHGNILYMSLINANVGNAPIASGPYWAKLIDFTIENKRYLAIKGTQSYLYSVPDNGLIVDPLDYLDCLTFQPITEGINGTYEMAVFNNVIGSLKDNYNDWDVSGSLLPNVVFLIHDQSGLIMDNVFDIIGYTTLIDFVLNVKVGKMSNVIINNLQNSRIGNISQSILYGVNYSSFLNDTSGILIGGGFIYNIVENCATLLIRGDCKYNKFDPTCNSLTVAGYNAARLSTSTTSVTFIKTAVGHRAIYHDGTNFISEAGSTPNIF